MATWKEGQVSGGEGLHGGSSYKLPVAQSGLLRYAFFHRICLVGSNEDVVNRIQTKLMLYPVNSERDGMYLSSGNLTRISSGL